MSKRRGFLEILFLIGVCFILQVSGEQSFYGYVQSYTVFGVNQPYDVFLLRNRFRLNTEISGDLVKGWASLDYNFESQPGGENSIDLREAYVDIYLPHLDLRIGKQQVVWGKADGLFINDLVNPLDLSLFILQDFEDIRMGLNMFKANFWYDNYQLELLAIPEFKGVKMAEEGSPWAFPQPQSLSIALPDTVILIIPSGSSESSSLKIPLGTLEVPVHYTDTKYPQNLHKMEYGLRLSGFSFGADWSLIYLKVREDFPIYFKSPDSTISFSGLEVPVSLKFQETHPWMQIYGANFSRAIGSFVVRGEGSVFHQRYFDYLPSLNIPDTLYLSEDPLMLETSEEFSTGLLKKKDFLQYMLGFDYPLTASINMSFQFIQQRILNYERALLQDEESNLFTFLLRGSYFNDTVRPIFLGIYNRSSGSSLARFWVDWEISDAFLLTMGIDLIEGEKGDFIGNFRDNDNIYLKVRYSF